MSVPSFEVRDVHYTHYGRMCPIETPEGPNIGLISYLATYARVNGYGFIEAPYRKVDKDRLRLQRRGIYDRRRGGRLSWSQATEPLDENGCLTNKRITLPSPRTRSWRWTAVVDYIDVSPQMMVSVATAMIPFLQNDDANRALMGANMQRQAVHLLVPKRPSWLLVGVQKLPGLRSVRAG